MEKIMIKSGVSLKRNGDAALFTFNEMLQIEMVLFSGTDLDMCLFWKTKDGKEGGVFNNEYNLNMRDLGSLDRFPFILHSGGKKRQRFDVRYNEQIKLKNIDVFSEIYVVAINYNAAIDNEMVTFDRNNGHIEITTDMDDNIDIPIDNPKAGQVYLICKIENIDACKKVVNIGNVLTLNQAFHQIPGFGLICDSDAKLKKKTLSDSQRFKWWWWWLLLIAIVVGLFFIMKKCSSGDCDIPAVKYPVKPADKTIVKEKAPAETIEKYSPAEKSDTVAASLPYKKGEAYTIYQFQSGESNCYRTNTELDKLIKTMSENKDMKIHIFAYTDKSGSVETNHALSQKRAKAIYDYIVSKGIDKSRLSYEGKDISTRYGNDAENRRAEFILK